jgi:FtsZ-interacting cell division protein ZipA
MKLYRVTSLVSHGISFKVVQFSTTKTAYVNSKGQSIDTEELTNEIKILESNGTVAVAMIKSETPIQKKKDSTKPKKDNPTQEKKEDTTPKSTPNPKKDDKELDKLEVLDEKEEEQPKPKKGKK